MTLEEMLKEVVWEGRVMCLCQQRDVPAENGCAFCEGDRYRTVKIRRGGVVSVTKGVYGVGVSPLLGI